MALKFREELVGKRFLAAKDLPKGRGVDEWEWRAGVVRAVLHGSVVNKDLQVLVEFDGVDWQRRESIRVHDTYRAFLVEKALVWARRTDPSDAGQEVCWPALNFTAIVGQAELASSPVQPIEFFIDHALDFQEEKDYCCQPSRQAPTTSTAGRRQAELDEAVRQWLEYQDGQSILLTTPTVLVGYRVKVYRTEGTTQWYTAVIQQYNHSTKKLTILDDTVLEEHNEDPAVTQIVLLDGVVESILKGIDQRIIPRRRACNARDKELLTAGGGGGSCAGTGSPLSTVGSTSLVLPAAGTPSRNRAVQAGNAGDYSRHVVAANSTAEHTVKQDRAQPSANQPRSSRKPKSVATAVSTTPTDEHPEHPKRAAAIALNDSASAKVLRATGDKIISRHESDSKRTRPSADSDHSSSGGDSSCASATGSVLREQRQRLDGAGGARRARKRPAAASPSVSLARAAALLGSAPVSQDSAPNRQRGDTRASTSAGADPAEADKEGQVGASGRWERNAADNAAAATAGCGLDAAASADKLALEVDASQPPSDMHYKKLHLLGTAANDPKPSGAAVAAAAAATAAACASSLEATEKPGNSSPALTGSESAGGSIDKLSDCGSTSGYSTATVDALSPRRSEPSAALARPEGSSSSSATATGSVGDTAWPTAERKAAVAGSRSDPLRAVVAAVARPFGCSTEPVQVYRDPELLKKDEETRASRLSLVGQPQQQQQQLLQLHQQQPLPEASVRGAGSSAQVSAGVLRSMPTPTGSAAAMGHQSLTAAAASAATAGAAGQHSGSVTAMTAAGAAMTAAATGVPTAASSQQQPQAAAAAIATASRASAQHLLSSVASAQHLAHLEQLQQMQLFQRQQELAAMAQLQFLWQQKYSCGGGGGHTAGVPWQLLAFHEDLVRRSYREAGAGSGDERLDRDRFERAEKGRQAIGGGGVSGGTVVGGGSSTGASTVDRRSHKLLSDADTAAHQKEPTDPQPPVALAVKIERDLSFSASTAAASAVDQHFSESLRLATKKASSSAAGPAWQHAASYHKLLSSAGYGGMQNGISEKLLSGQSRLAQLQDGDSIGRDVNGIELAKGYTSTADPSSSLIGSSSILKAEPLVEVAKDRHALQRSIAEAAGHFAATIESDGYYRRSPGEPHPWGAVHPGDPLRLSPGSAGGNGGEAAAVSRHEPNFSLYGFQPYHTTYISQDKLHRRLDRPPLTRDELGAASAPRIQENGTAGSRVGSIGHDVAADVKVEVQWSPRSEAGHSERSPQKQPAAAAPARPAASGGACKPAAGPPLLPPLSADRHEQPPAAAVDGPRKQGSRRKQLSPAFRASPASSTSSTSCSLPKRFARSDAAADPYQHLIQEGLVPNPIYSQASLPLPTRPVAGASLGVAGRGGALQHGASVPQQQRGEEAAASKRSQNGSADCTAAALPERSPSGLPTPLFVAAGPLLGGSSESVIRHSFKSILESAMQKAYMQDLEEDRKKEQQRDLAAARDAACFTPPCVVTVGSSSPLPVTLGVPPMLSPNGDTQGSVGSTSTAASSRCSRGAAAAETDSDTLSAPSPPACLTGALDNSNDDSSRAEAPALPAHHQHPKLKKAWLQRHSGEGSTGAGAALAASATAARASFSSASSHRQLPVVTSPLPSLRTCGMAALPAEAGAAAAATPAQLSADSDEPLSAILASSKANRCYHGDTTSSASEAEVESRALLKRKASNGQLLAKAKKPRTTSGGGSSSARASSGSMHSQSSAGSRRAKPASRRDSLRKQSSGASGSSRALESDAADTDDSDTVLSAVQKKKRRLSLAFATGSIAAADTSGSEGGIGKPAQPNVPASKPMAKSSSAQLKKSGQPFLQDGYCCEVTPKLQKCRECKMTPHQRSKKMPNIFCRFYAFRRLRFSQRGILTTAGFSEPADAEFEDLQLWLPSSALENSPKVSHSAPPLLDVATAKYIIANVGDEFCKLVEQEKECRGWANPNDKIMWKRAVQGVRETCDVCDTTLFNMHWVCQKCGFVVCMDCYRAKRNLCSNFGPTVSTMPSVDEKGDGDCGRTWLTCSSGRQPHEATKLTLTQIIPGDALFKISDMIHDVRQRHGIKANCPCGRNSDLGSEDSETDCIGSSTGDMPTPKNGVCQQLLKAVSRCYPSTTRKASKLSNGDISVKGAIDRSDSQQSCYDDASKSFGSYSDDPLSLLADVASMDSSSRDKASVNSTINTKKDGIANGIAAADDAPTSRANGARKGCHTLRTLLLSHSVDDGPSDGSLGVTNGKSPAAGSPVSYNYYQPRNGSFMRGRRKPVPVCQLKETSLLYPDVPHSWLCEGRLLRLHDPRHGRNFTLFNQRWKLGQPVIVSNVTTQMQVENLWSPAAFSQEFGHMEGDLVNCRSGVVIVGRQIKDFWDGFENPSRRVVDSDRQPMLLKLKDWPPGEDFSDVLPTRFQDLMNALPMPEYTLRDGHLNLASRLPDFFVKPDLGPKMYNAYGMAKCPHLGTTNLHLDISDAVNVMVYVAYDAAIEADVLRCIDESDVDDVTRQRIATEKEVPGALWHIWDACDADKIRDLLNKVAAERGEHVEPYHDPIHDQSWYLDNALRARLRREYCVNGFAIVQCAGDALFIPAGAPHQVQNLNSCIKVAEDFVSPEHLHHCFKLTQEFRHLSSTHSNHEDKLQVKNIIYHAVKDAVAVLSTAVKTADSTDDHRHLSKRIPPS